MLSPSTDLAGALHTREVADSNPAGPCTQPLFPLRKVSCRVPYRLGTLGAAQGCSKRDSPHVPEAEEFDKSPGSACRGRPLEADERRGRACPAGTRAEEAFGPPVAARREAQRRADRPP